MAWSAHQDPDLVKEHFAEETIIDGQAKKLTKWIREAKHFVVFTGAGISTSAGIPDFRGPDGVWTTRARGAVPKSRTNSIKAMPTPSHMALVGLQKAGLLKFLISQNTDGLHRRSGFPPEFLAELHGNTNLEYCKRCGKEVLRDFGCSRHNNDVHDHRTGRICSACGGELYDSIINFHENLPEKPLKNGFYHGRHADVMLVLGSSLTVTPAADMPRATAENGKGKLVICNLQKTPLDAIAAEKIYAKCDDLMQRVMTYLQVPIPDWRLRRQVEVRFANEQLTVAGVEADGTPASIFSGVQVSIPDEKFATDLETEPFTLDLRKAVKQLGVVKLKLFFMGHYNEPPLELSVSAKENLKRFNLAYDPKSGRWAIE